MRMKKFAILSTVMLILLVLSSGCITGDKDEDKPTEGRTDGITYGLAITDFSSIPEVESGEQVDVSIDVQNVGDEEARAVFLNLYQLSGFYLISEQVKDGGDLLPPERELGVEGESFSTHWTIEAPTVSSDQVATLKARISYAYNSTASTNLYLVNKEEWNRLGPESFNTYSTASIGPVSIYALETPPIKITKTGAGTKKVALNMIIENTGSGRVVGNMENFMVKVKRGGTTWDLVSNPDRIDCSEDFEAGTYDIKLYGTEQQRSVKCYLDLDYPSEGSVSYIVEVEAEYSYYIDTEPLALKIKKL